jgi:BRCT domain type II-containing protein
MRVTEGGIVKKKKTSARRRPRVQHPDSGSGTSFSRYSDQDLADVGDDSAYPEVLHRIKEGQMSEALEVEWLGALVEDLYASGGISDAGDRAIRKLSEKYPECAESAHKTSSEEWEG